MTRLIKCVLTNHNDQYNLAVVNLIGFLSTGDEVAPGNWGLLDNVIALEWVRDNIASFGGDPTQVTVFGHSAGAVMASMHMYSPLSSGLIAGSLPQSGNAMTPWAVYRSPHDPLDNARELAELVNCPTTSSSDIVDCLRAKPWQELVDQPVNVSVQKFKVSQAQSID
ncbi:carboxylesterase 5A-like [Glandiceps talaboti]